MEPTIIFQDDNLLVLLKPSGFITNEADTTTNQPVVQTWIKKTQKYEISGSREFRSGIVHRLDKETSGILVVAKTEAAFAHLQNQFKERMVKKRYLALVHGRVEPGSGEIKATVGRLPWRRDRFGILPGGRDSLTKYKVLSYYPQTTTNNREPGDFSLVEFYPETGRTHQIRIHAKFIGHPVVSDEFYAGRKTARRDRKFCPRLFLHASSISFYDTVTGNPLNFESQLPPDLKSVLSGLKMTPVA